MKQRKPWKKVDIPHIHSPLVRHLANYARLGSQKVHPLASAQEVFGRQQADIAVQLRKDFEQWPAIDSVSTRLKGRLGSAWRLDVHIVTTGNVNDISEKILHHIWDVGAAAFSAVVLHTVGSDGAVADCASLGFKQAAVYPHELYDRFGPSQAAPRWRP
ncbi:MAG: hypothetical protein Q4P66_03070 [Actinomycetaceae bacterium]|nr:hypothetical protein [Actinomycetaceae bacterium]